MIIDEILFGVSMDDADGRLRNDQRSTRMKRTKTKQRL